MTLARETELPRRPCARDDGYLVERILARDAVRERAAGEHLLIHALQLVVAIRAIHEQPDEVRVARERSAVRMIGGEHHAPGIGREEKELESDDPLQRRDGCFLTVAVRDDAAPGLELDVGVDPLPAGAHVEQILDRAIRRERRRVAEHDLADIAGDLGMPIHIFSDLASRGAPRFPALSTVAVKLQVREMGSPALECTHGVERHRHVARNTEVVAVDVRGMRQPELVRGVGEHLEDPAWSDVRGTDGIIERLHLAHIPLPQLDPARIHDLDRVRARGLQNPRRIVLRPAHLVRRDLAMQIIIVAQQREKAAVDDRRVIELCVCLASGYGCDGGIEHGGVAEPRVAIAGREGARDGAAAAGARDCAVLECRRAHRLERVLLRQQPPAERHAR